MAWFNHSLAYFYSNSVVGNWNIVSLAGVGPVIDVVRQLLRDEKVDSQKGSIQELEAKLAKLEKELNALKTVGQVQIPSSSMASKAGNNPDFNTNLNERPEDLRQIFRMKEFIRPRL